MADIAAQPFLNYGLSQAQQGQATAAAGLENQQAAAASMQNQIMKARMPFIMRAYSQMGANSDTSGVDGQGDAGGPMAAKEQSLSDNGFDPDQITKQNNSKYYVPEWTKQEQSNTQLAAMSNDPGVVNYYALQRQQRLDTQRQQAAYSANNQYSKYAAATNAPSAYEYLKQADSQYTNWLDRFADEQSQQGNPIDKEQASRAYAQYQAADLHKYTGRKLEYKNDQAVDADTGLPVAGIPRLAMSAKDQAEFVKAAQTPTVEVATGVPGQTKKMTPWQAAGYSNVHDYLAATEQGNAPTPQALQQMTAGKVLTAAQLADLRNNANTAALQRAGQGNAPAPFKPTDHAAPDPKNPGAPVPMPAHPKQKTPPPAQPVAAGAAPVAPASPAGGAPSAQPAANAQAAPFTGREGLPGVDPDKLPKYTPPANAPNTTASTQQNLDITAHNKEKYAQLGNANQQLQKNANERGLLDQAQVEINNLKSDPRVVGPGSQITTAWNEFKSYVTGKTPDPLVERKMFDKILLQMGAVNVKQAFDGQNRIGQQEYMKLLTEGNPTGQMPLDAIQKLVDFARYNNEFSTRSNNTKVAALNRGADPYSAEFNNLDQGRAAYVQSRMNPGKQAPQPDVTQAQHAALAQGEPYYWKGQLHHKGVD